MVEPGFRLKLFWPSILSLIMLWFIEADWAFFLFSPFSTCSDLEFCAESQAWRWDSWNGQSWALWAMSSKTAKPFWLKLCHVLKGVYPLFKLHIRSSVLSGLCCSQVIFLTLKHNILGSSINKVKTVKMLHLSNQEVHDPCKPSILIPKASALVAHVWERLMFFICT